jgi:hypothetical protein
MRDHCSFQHFGLVFLATFDQIPIPHDHFFFLSFQLHRGFPPLYNFRLLSIPSLTDSIRDNILLAARQVYSTALIKLYDRIQIPCLIKTSKLCFAAVTLFHAHDLESLGKSTVPARGVESS